MAAERLTIALAGNPNSGKTTAFNALTGANQRVGNWPGVTVEKKEGSLKGNKAVTVQDLPGIYSLSPYSPEEVITRNYLVDQRPEVIIDIVDASNLERNLYLTTQLTELGIPVVLALNMIDVVRKRGDAINIEKLSEVLGVAVVETSAIKGEGCQNAADKAIWLASQHGWRHKGAHAKADSAHAKADSAHAKADSAHAKADSAHAIFRPKHRFANDIEQALRAIGAIIKPHTDDVNRRWYCVKVFERDPVAMEALALGDEEQQRAEAVIARVEAERDDDSESIIANERYSFITSVIDDVITYKQADARTISDRIDSVVTNRVLALPIFVAVMFLVYFISISTVGTAMTDWVNDGLFGSGFFVGGGEEEYTAALDDYDSRLQDALQADGSVEAAAQALADQGVEEPDPRAFGTWVLGAPLALTGFLESVQAADWLQSLLVDGITAGVGAVLGFLPQMLVLFLLLALLEECGYMARIAFIMDRVFKRFGLSGKSFIPILIGTGCGVPGILSSRTIENESNRRLTVMTTTFIPCSAKLPIIALITGAVFAPDQAVIVAPATYFIGIAAIISSGVLLKKTRLFAGDPSPFLIELPSYHAPRAKSVLRTMLERGWAFVKRAGTIILLATMGVWFLSSFGISDGGFGMVDTTDSILAAIGTVVAGVFAPLGWGGWQEAVATITGLIAKENVVGTFGVLFSNPDVAEDGFGIWSQVNESFTQLSGGFTALAAFSFLLFNLLCAPCFAAIGAIHREMASPRWTFIAVGYQCLFAYCAAFCVYQIGICVAGNGFGVGTAIAILIVAAFLFLLFRPDPNKRRRRSLEEGGAESRVRQ